MRFQGFFIAQKQMLLQRLNFVPNSEHSRGLTDKTLPESEEGRGNRPIGRGNKHRWNRRQAKPGRVERKNRGPVVRIQN